MNGAVDNQNTSDMDDDGNGEIMTVRFLIVLITTNHHCKNVDQFALSKWEFLPKRCKCAPSHHIDTAIKHHALFKEGFLQCFGLPLALQYLAYSPHLSHRP